ncbi:chitin-binding protein [Pseudomonas kairouanensis]|uniref:Chitin-binding protein n=1 Tax=Pseudomonas kairouanensis TaxID=2293832 RepID=A0A4Z0AVR9_9PSED|nr:lytic polysaccharide monooxygenase [Pseudomonas kairouanensis]TFY90008.1 chitin-binding protein [Pseudomonas kairouanensis]
MNNLQLYVKNVITWVLAALLLTPVLGWTHGALDFPQTRAVNCQVTGGYWNPPIVDKGCRESAKIFNTNAEKVYAAQQWNEVAKIPLINNPTLAQIQAIINDGQICSANDPQKASLDLAIPDWTKTPVTAGQPLTMRLIGTAPHVPSTFYAFTTRPGFNSATDTLKWSDLVPLGGPEALTVANTVYPPNNPPKIRGAWGYFEITRPLPNGLSGNGLIVTIWIRSDPDGEFFIGCSDVTFQGAGTPDPLTPIGQFIGTEMQALKPGDTVHYRIFDAGGARDEVVDVTQLITPSNLGPGQWGKELAAKVDPSFAQIGEQNPDGTVTFNSVDALLNIVYAKNPSYTDAMSIIAGGQNPIDQTPPTAHITGPTSLKSGEAFTFSGAGSTAKNGTPLFQWSIPGLEGSQSGTTASGTALPVTTPSQFKARLNVRDPKNGKTDQAEFGFTVTPGGGGTHPDYKEGTAYKDGDIVTNNGKNYKCKPHPFTAWCGGAAWAYAPGTGTAWQQAWDLVP